MHISKLIPIFTSVNKTYNKMKTIIINSKEYSKNVELIKSFGFINEYCLINRFEFNIQTVEDIKRVLKFIISKYENRLDSMMKTHEDINYMDCDQYRDYEGDAEYWSCLGLDLEKIN